MQSRALHDLATLAQGVGQSYVHPLERGVEGREIVGVGSFTQDVAGFSSVVVDVLADTVSSRLKDLSTHSVPTDARATRPRVR